MTLVATRIVPTTRAKVRWFRLPKIWPGRPLVMLMVFPVLLSLGLLVIDWLRPWIILFDAAIALVAMIDLLTLIGADRWIAERSCTSVASIGEPFDVELTITNMGWSQRIVKLRDDLPPTFLADPVEFEAKIPGRGGRTILVSHVKPLRRGSYRFERVDTLVQSRLGFWRRQVEIEATSEVKVYPDVRQLSRYTVLARRDKLSALGVRQSRQLGTDNEFERLRDYSEGDEPRHMDWRATARRRKLTVRAHQVNQSQRLIFLIDCGRMMAGNTGGGLSPLDHAFNAMLMLAHVALIRGDQVGLMVFSDRVRAFVPPMGGPHRTPRLIHAVHNIFPEIVEPRYDHAFIELEKRCRKRSLVVLMTSVMDDVNAQIVADQLGRTVGKHLPLGVFLRDQDLFRLADRAPEHGLEMYQGAAAAGMLNWRETALSSLRKRGIMTLDVDPTDLTAPLVNQYLDIKARHLL